MAMIPRPSLSRFLPVMLATGIIGGIFSFSIAYFMIGAGIHFWPYFRDGLIFGLLLGAALSMFRSYAMVAIFGALSLVLFGCLYWYFLIALIGV